MRFNVVKILVSAAGLSLAMIGPLAGIAVIATALISPQQPSLLESALLGISIATLGLGLGGALAWHGMRALQGYPSTPFRLPRAWLLGLLFILTIILGQELLSLELVPWLTFPLIHVMAVAMPLACILAYVGHRLAAAGVRWRDMFLQGASGAFVSTTAAFILEGALLLGMAMVVVVIAFLTPSGRTELETLITNLQDPLWVMNEENVYDLLLRPAVALPLAATLMVIAPVTEELLKPLGVILLSYRRPTRAQAWLGGLACGAGFALVEGLLNTATSLDAWGPVVLARAGASLMHCLGSGLVALGWQRLLAERRPWKLVGAFLISVAVHALWNLATIGLVGVSLAATGPTEDEWLVALGGIGGIGLLLLLAILTAGVALGLVLLTRRLEKGLLAGLHSPPAE